MQYWSQFLRTLMLMLIIFQFGFSMERPPRKSILNPDAAAFVPHLPSPEYRQTHQHQANQNPTQFQLPIHQSPRHTSPEFHQQPHSIPNTDTKYQPLAHFPNLIEFHPSSSNPQIASEELDEHEALSLLPDFMQDEFGQKKVSDNVNQKEEAGSSQETRLISPDKGEEGSQNKKDFIEENVDQGEQTGNQNAHLKPREMREEISKNAFTQKLSEKENPAQIEKNNIDSTHQNVNPFLKFGSIPEILLTSQKQKDQAEQKIPGEIKVNIKDERQPGHSEKLSLDKVGTLGHEIKGLEKEKVEKSERIHENKKPETTHSSSDSDSSNSEKKIEKGREQKSSKKERKQQWKDGEDPNKKPIEMAKTAAESREQKMEMKEKHLDDQEKKEKFIAVKKDVQSSTKLDKTFMAANSSPSYYKRKEKQEHSQKQVKQQDKKQQVQSDSGSISPSYSSIHKHQSPKVEKKPALVISPRTLKKTPEDTSHAINLANTSKYDILAREELTDPTEVNEEKEEEISEKTVDKHKEQSESESRNQQGSWQQQSAKSKGKSALINTKEIKKSQKEKEKEEAKLLHEEMKKAAKERWEHDQLRKQKLDYRIGEHKKKMEELGHSEGQLETPPTESTKTNLVHGEGSGSGSGIERKGERLTVLPVPDSYKIVEETNKSAIDMETELLLHKKIAAERQKKSKQIKDILKKLQEKINEIEKFEKELKEEEKNWLLNEIKKFSVEIAKRNGKENVIRDIERSGAVKELLGKININVSKKEKEIFLNLESYLNLDKEIGMQKVELAKLENEYEGLNKNKNSNKKKMEKKLKLLEIKLSNQQKNVDIFEKEMEKKEKLLMEEFIKMNNNEGPENEKMKEILGKMNAPLTYLWTAYNLVLAILDQHWKQPYIMNQFKLKRPYYFISAIFGITICEKDCGEDKEEFNNTMQLTLKKMLIHRNIYRNMNLVINGVSVHERLNCFDELSGRINWLAEERKKTEIEANHGERMEIFGKFFKEELNKTFHDVLHFNMVGLDKLPDLWDQMILEGIGRLSHWLPKDWQRQFNEIWLELYEYFEEEKHNLEWLTFEDEVAEVVLDLFPDVEYADKRFKKQLENIDNLYNRMDESVKFSNEVKNFMLDAFDRITAWIRSSNILLKIVKRKEHALLYLTSVYDKYFYMVSGMKFRQDFLLVRQYHFYKDKNQAAIDVMEEIVSEKLDIRAEIKPIFDQIKQNEPTILNEMMEVIEAIDEVVAENGIIDRAVNFERDEDFMKSFFEENKSEYEYRKNMFT